MDRMPQLGDDVLYFAYGTPNGEFKSVPRAAKITEVDPETQSVKLVIFNPTGLFFSDFLARTDHREPGRWDYREM
jgi:hypothetical protein